MAKNKGKKHKKVKGRGVRSELVVSEARNRVSAAERAPPPRLSSVRRFSGAKLTRTTSHLSRMPRPINADVADGVRILRARARDAEQNSDHARAFFNLLRTNVIGPTGFRFRPRVQRRDPQGTLDTVANEALKDAWEAQSWPLNWSISQTLGRVLWEQLTITTVARDGEAIYRKRVGRQWGRYGFTLEPIDVELLPVDLTQELPNGNRVEMGVELDSYRRRVAYHFRVNPMKQRGDYEYSGGRVVRIPAEEILHIFFPLDATAVRGVPWISSALIRLEMLGGIEESELVAMRAAAAKMGFYEQDESAGTEFESELEEAADAGQVGTDGEVIEHAEPGLFQLLPRGTTFKAFDPQHPSTAFDPFVKHTLRSIAAGIGSDYSALTGDYTSGTWATLRQEKLDARDVWTALQGWFDMYAERPVFDAWLDVALLAGINIGSSSTTLRAQDRERYRRATFAGRRWRLTDPNNEMSAAEKGVKWSLRSRSSLMRDQGDDPAEVFEEIEQERAEMKRRGIPLNDGEMSAPTEEPEPEPEPEPETDTDAAEETDNPETESEQ